MVSTGIHPNKFKRENISIMNILQLKGNNKFISSDMLGALASSLCLVHCLITPFIFVAQAYAASSCESSPFWWSTIDYIFLVISIIAVRHSAKETTLGWMPAALYGSWALLALFILNERFHLLHLSHMLIYLPAIALIGLHLYNRKYCRCEDDQCCVAQ